MANMKALTAEAIIIQQVYSDIVRSIYVNDITDLTLFGKAIKVYVYFKDGTKMTRIITENELRSGTVNPRKQFHLMLEEMISAAKEENNTRDSFTLTAIKYHSAFDTRVRSATSIKNVIFNDPATIVFWSDGTKTVVKAQDESYDPEKGLAMAIAKKFLGNQGNYYNTFTKWLPEEEPGAAFDMNLKEALARLRNCSSILKYAGVSMEKEDKTNE